ncbi:hypothetical protein FB451DRAFT_1375536 [Mycena latifolia]|nr:hypothetical protein FB451DRAFT_1375536 [Mycena latifolia]
MGDKKSASARRLSKRLAQQDTQAPSSPSVLPTLSSDLGPGPLSTTVDWSVDEYLPHADGTGSESDNISLTSPIPMTNQAPKKPKKRAVSESSDSDADVQPPPKKQRAKKTKDVTEDAEDLSKRALVINVPRVSEIGNQRVELTHATEFTEALTIIYKILGCTDVARKPVLAYKLSNATLKASPMTLDSESDWTGCLKDLRQVENSKKAGTIIPVLILVTEQYLASLASKLGKNKGAATAKSRGKGGKAKVQILDLDHAESGDDDFDEGLGGMEAETKFVEQLQNEYGRCQLCGPSKACKITASGTHHPLSNNQLRAWAQALALGTHNVTLKTPPRDLKGQGLFSMFFKSTARRSAHQMSLSQYLQSSPLSVRCRRIWP